jgi:hypothetical protein
MLKRAGKAGSHHVLRRQQGQKTEEADANPRQEPKRCSEEAGAHLRRLSGLGGFGKSGPRVLAPPALTLVPAEVAGAILKARSKGSSSLRAKGKRANRATATSLMPTVERDISMGETGDVSVGDLQLSSLMDREVHR